MTQQDAKWALITGASSGIGAALAKAYAKQHINVVLVARREEKLQQLADELRQHHNIKTHIIVQDLSKPNAAVIIDQYTTSHGIDVDILVNNAGYGFQTTMMHSKWPRVDAFLNVMVGAITELTHIYMRKMIKKKFGRVVFISSAIAHIPGSASVTLYNAVKTYMIKLSEGLWAEGKPHGVHVTVACPGLTLTEFQKVAGYEEQMKKSTPSWFWMPADKVAHLIVRASEKNRVVISTGWVSKTLHVLAHLTPNSLWRWFDQLMFKLKKMNQAK